MSYLVLAYRFGWINYGWYIVYGGEDRAKACELASIEAHYRGGKYGCAVYEFTTEGTESQIIAYEPSAHGEKAPEHNERIEYYRRLGQFTDEYARGSVLLPDPAQPGRLVYTTITAPDVIVIEEVNRQKKILETWPSSLRLRPPPQEPP